jgi:hypothetical protein
MKQELNRIKNDVETIQKAMGLPPVIGREWIQWVKRDRWFSLWWCLPGLIIIAAALLPLARSAKYLGLVPDQWAGILVALSLLVVASFNTRQMSGKDGRPEGMVREARRLYGVKAQCGFGMVSLIQIGAFVIWSRQHHLGFDSFWTGLFVIWGTTYLVAALASRAWILLGYGIPFMAYGLCVPMANGHFAREFLFGMMFIAVALSFSVIQVWQIHQLESQK